MSIISNNLNLNSNTNVTSNLRLSYLGSAGIVHSNNDGNLSSSLITDSDISQYAEISDTKLGIISTIGKVSNSATTANIDPLQNTIALRDIDGFLYSNTPMLDSSNNMVATTAFVQESINRLVDNAPEMLNTLGELASVIEQNNVINIVEDITNINLVLDLKADNSIVDTSLNLKADKTYVDEALNLKADKSEVDTAIDESINFEILHGNQIPIIKH